LAAASSSILASIGISRDSPDRGLSHAEIAAAESVFQARLIASKIYDHSKRMKEKRAWYRKSEPSAVASVIHNDLVAQRRLERS
jgi:hypothetical protein